MLNKIKIGPKLIGGFLIVSLIAAVIGIIGIVNMKTIGDADTKLYEKMLVPITLMSDASTYFQRVRINSRDIIRANNAEEIAENQKVIEELSSKVVGIMETFEKLIVSDEMKKAFSDFQTARNEYREDLGKILELAKANKDAEAYLLLDGSGYKSAAAEQAAIDKLIELKNKDAKETSDNNTKTANAASTILITSMIIGVLLALIIGIALTLSLTSPLNKAVEMIQELGKGHLGMRLNMKSEDEIGIMSQAMDKFADDLQTTVVGNMQKISDGDLSMDITIKDNQDEISPALKKTIETIHNIIKEFQRLTVASQNGMLSERGKPEQFKGSYMELIQGTNTMLDAILLPIGEGNRILAQVSNGKIDELIMQTYKGDHEVMKQNINNVAIVLQGFQKEFQRLTVASQNGMLSERGKPEQFKGAYADVIQGANTMLDAILLPIGEGNRIMAQVSNGKIDELIMQTYKGDHEAMKQNINNIAIVMQGLTKELGRLINASREGQLSERGKADQFKGAYSEVIQGVNSMLDVILMPINEAAEILEKVAARDMTARVKGDYKGDHAKIKVALNTTVENLDTALLQVAQGTEQVSSAGQQISSGSQALAQGANEQASSLEEVSSSLEEMASMTKQNADNANQAKNLAAEANSNAAQGKHAMTRMSESINKIKESSDQTAKIVKTIDEIAMQTNLLALNAAVEAARAGEAGRGFAVVAEEVRNLAQRSAEAAKNTANMIEESVKNAEDGVTIAVEVAQSFETIAGSNSKVDNLIAEIAAASKEQSQGIEQINTAVAQMDKVTQQNAANSEESASAAEELSAQAEELQNMVTSFKLTSSAIHTSRTTIQHNTHLMQQPKPMVEQKTEQKRKNDNSRSVKNIKSLSNHTEKEMSSKHVIPLEDDEVLKDF